VLYFVNRLVLKKISGAAFLHDHLNDLICIPFWVPIMLSGLRVLRLRKDDGMPRAHEVLIPLLVWSVVFELLLPQMRTFERLAVSDPEDVLFYTLGACLSMLFWKAWYRGPAVAQGGAPVL